MSSDPSVLLKWILKSSGFTKQPGKKSLLYSVMSRWTAFQMCVIIFSVWKFAFEDHPFFDKGLSLEAMCSTTYLATKIINVKIRMKKFWQIMTDAENILNELTTLEKYKKLLETRRANVTKLIRIIMMIYIVPNSLTVILSLPSNMMKDDNAKELIYKIWDPFRDTLGEDYFWARYTYEAIFVGWTLLLFGVAISMLIYCSHMACIMMDVFILMLEEKTIDVPQCVLIHQKILKFVHDLNDYYSGLLLIELIFSAIVISLRVYVVFLMWKGGDERVIGEMTYIVIVMLDPFMICYNGQIIMDRSENVFKSSYQNHWYELSVKDQKSLNLLMCRASRTLQLRYRRLMTFDMIRYGTVLQGTYSYITILLQV